MTTKTTVAQNSDTIRRILIWAAQGAISLVCFMLWTSLQEMKVEQARIAGTQQARGERFVMLESQAAQYGRDISEIKSLLRTLEGSLSDLRLSLAKGDMPMRMR